MLIRRLGRGLVAVLFGLIVTSLFGPAASADTPRHPHLVFVKNMANPLDSRLYLYYSKPNDPQRYYIVMRAGSGVGSTDDCQRNRGFLPDGTYPVRQWNVPGTPHTTKTTLGGPVWYLGNHLCHGNLNSRTELFIHSNGVRGTRWNGNYATDGCIKISQADRDRLLARWRIAYDTVHADLLVRS
ncbi:L,D-transpeptidase family protein [Cryptosporangium phraense]|uniref:L,D-TPase catalytic domain-containing protein n=1 Tax=Cryptosporangium phraense TaxID=2593070 RepID=A0A545AX58_9ACTN|nr:L,D-transpeptidase family protein [Cryptosporangium phraense]TQS45917.1 hypothetical protein FL583_05315 [Cryptosporangium phraense]